MTNNLNLAEWIIVGILSFFLLLFLILAIVLTVKLIKLTNNVKKVVATGQSIADKAEAAIDNVRDMTTSANVAKIIMKKLFKWHK